MLLDVNNEIIKDLEWEKQMMIIHKDMLNKVKKKQREFMSYKKKA